MSRTGHARLDVERALAEVRACNGNVSRAARNLGISRTTIQSWVSGVRQPEVVRDAETGGLNEGDLRAKLRPY